MLLYPTHFVEVCAQWNAAVIKSVSVGKVIFNIVGKKMQRNVKYLTVRMPQRVNLIRLQSDKYGLIQSQPEHLGKQTVTTRLTHERADEETSFLSETERTASDH